MKDGKFRPFKDIFGRLKNLIFPLAAFALILAVWAIAAHAADLPLVLPTPKETFVSFWALLGNGSYWQAVGLSVFRALRSFLYAVAAGAVLAAVAAFSETVEKLLDPVVSVLRSVPTMSIILIAILWLGSKTAPILIAFLITFPLLYQGFLDSLKSVDRGILEMADVYRVSRKDKIFRIYLPAVSEGALSVMKSTVSLSLKIIIASEVMAQTRQSIGLYMQRAMVTFETAELIAWTVVAVVFSYLLEIVVGIIKKAVVRWKR